MQYGGLVRSMGCDDGTCPCSAVPSIWWNDLEQIVWLLLLVSQASQKQRISHFQGVCVPGNLSALDDPSNICVFLVPSEILTGILEPGSATLENLSLQLLSLVPEWLPKLELQS